MQFIDTSKALQKNMRIFIEISRKCLLFIDNIEWHLCTVVSDIINGVPVICNLN